MAFRSCTNQLWKSLFGQIYSPSRFSKAWNPNGSYRALSTSSSFFSLGNDEHVVDTLIIGGGVMGTSTAYHLAKARRSESASSSPSIVVVERDPTYEYASSALSAGGIRQQFSMKENIQMTLYGQEFLQNAAELLTTTTTTTTQTGPNPSSSSSSPCDVAFQQHGYMFLTSSEEGANQMRKSHQVQSELGCQIQLLSPSQVQEKFGSWMTNTDHLKLATFSQGGGEGYFDPWALLRGMKEKAIEYGVQFVTGQAIRGHVDSDTGNVTSVVVQNKTKKQTSTTDTTTVYHVQNVVNAGGPHANAVLDLLLQHSGRFYHEIPVRPRKRCIFFFHCSAPEECMPPPTTPLTVDVENSVYFRPEGQGPGTFLCGTSPSPEQDPDYEYCTEPLAHVDHDLFTDKIWPGLCHRIPAFESIKVKSFWAGYYDYNSIDQNAIIGMHPDAPNVYLINGFSGHGLQQSPAAGRAIAELIEHDGTFQTLDLSIFQFERFLEGGSPVYEAEII